MEEDIITIQEIFRYRRRGHGKDGKLDGDFETTGVRPKVMDMLAGRGIETPNIMFAPGRKSV